MRYLLFAFYFIVSCLTAYSQQKNTDLYPRVRFSSAMGFLKMTGKADGVDEQISIGVKPELSYMIHLSGKNYLQAGLGMELNRHIADGFFSKVADQYIFYPTAPLVKQHELLMTYLDLPVTYKYKWMPTGFAGIGVFGGYLLEAKTKYKVGNSKYEENAPVQNKFRWGIRAEWELFKIRNTDKSGSVFGMGMQYQVSRHLDDKKSFKPLFVYFMFGMALR